MRDSYLEWVHIQNRSNLIAIVPKSNKFELNMGVFETLKRARRNEAFNDQNLVRLAMLSFSLSLFDTLQSFYLQKVLNVYGELSPVSQLFFQYGAPGFVAYVPIAFLGAYVTFLALWGGASYVVWYYSNIFKQNMFGKIASKTALQE